MDDEEKSVRKRLFPKSPSRGFDGDDLLYRPKVRTEDLGKTFEMAICKAAGIDFCGSYKYHSPPPKLVSKIQEFSSTIKNLKHVAAGGSRHDFRGDGYTVSAKTSKQITGKVAPQVIGQPSLEKFRSVVGLSPDQDVKEYIYDHIRELLGLFLDYTFDSHVLYYNQARGEIRRIRLRKEIDWSQIPLEWTRDLEEWNNSNTLKAGKTSLLEIQVHSASRSNLVIRWYIENLLDFFPRNFSIKAVSVSP
jgi:hypothetical protein